MARGGTWRKGNSLLVILPAMKDLADPGTPVVATGGVMTVYVLDELAQDELSAAAITSATTLFVRDSDPLTIGDAVIIQLDDGVRHAATISDIPNPGELTITPGIASGAGVGARVIRKVGAPITGSEYGTASIDTEDWGYVAEVVWSYGDVVLDEGMRILIEAVVDVSGTGAHYEKAWSVVRAEALGLP